MRAVRNLLGLLLATALYLPAAENPADRRLPVRGFCIPSPSANRVDEFIKFIEEELAPRSVNTLILRVDYNFQYTSHPELADPGGLSREQAQKISETCKRHQIRIIPLINLLGHQSWHSNCGKLLKAHPEFDETPGVKFPEKYVWPNSDGLYCKSYCPRHPKIHEVVFALADEVCEAFGADAFHAGMDEVFYILKADAPFSFISDDGHGNHLSISGTIREVDTQDFCLTNGQLEGFGMSAAGLVCSSKETTEMRKALQPFLGPDSHYNPNDPPEAESSVLCIPIGQGYRLSVKRILSPQLTIKSAGANVILRWPTNDIWFTLQSPRNLSSPVWSTNSAAPIVVSLAIYSHKSDFRHSAVFPVGSIAGYPFRPTKHAYQSINVF